MVGIAFKMLAHNKARLVVTIAGIAVLFFLSAAQVGLLVGWCFTTSAIIRHTNADIWVMAKRTPAFDYGTAMPELREYQVRNVPGVAWAEGMFMAWNTWERPDGRRVNVELVGLDQSCVGGPWNLRDGTLESVHLPDSVIVDELFLSELGVHGPGDEVEMYGERALVRGTSIGVRTFTASPFVFTSIKSARKYDRRYADDEITYVLARTMPGCKPEDVRDAILRDVPNVKCLTKREFAILTMRYWMLETGVGITVVLTAILGFLVSIVVLSQTLFAITQDHQENYAALLALGFGRGKLLSIVLFQSLFLGSTGSALGSVLYFWAANMSQRTPIPLQTTPMIFSGLIAASLAFCLVASFLAVRAILQTDPGQVFRA